MTFTLDRRTFIGGSAAAAGGLAVGIRLPSAGPASAQTVGAAPGEITAWVVIKPDDTVVIRIARSEMGQGSLTGLAQLVAEELECDWSRVTTEYPTPGANLARNRVWGNFATGGSTGIRLSRDYVRRGGAMARTMLVQAAADEWKVAATECTAADSIITHRPTGRSDDLRQGRHGGGQAAPADRGNAEEPGQLEDRRPTPQAAGHRSQAHGRPTLRHRPQATRHVERRDQGVPRRGRQAEELRFRRDPGQARRAQGRPGGRQRGGGHRRHLVARQEGSRGAACRVG